MTPTHRDFEELDPHDFMDKAEAEAREWRENSGGPYSPEDSDDQRFGDWQTKAVVGMAIALIGAIGLTLSYCSKAWSHDFWINNSGYRSTVDGSHCCGDNDCRSFKEGDVKVTPTGYALPNGELVPFAEAQVGEDSFYWRCMRYDGSRRCFFTPAGGT